MSELGNKEIMAKNIRHYLSINNLTQKDICDALGFKAPTFSDWVNAKTYPRIDKIEMMANYFGISKSDLVEEKPTSGKNAEDGLSNSAKEFLAMYNLLDVKMQDKLLEVVRLYLEARDKNKDSQ